MSALNLPQSIRNYGDAAAAIAALTNIVVEQQNALTTITERMAEMTAALQAVTASLQPPAPANVTITPNISGAVIGAGIEKPAKFKGDSKDVETVATHARQFLAAFVNWASQQPQLTPYNSVTKLHEKEQRRWIASFLSFMDGPAGVWATPFIEDIGNGHIPWQGTWDEARKAFEERFSVVAQGEVAREALKRVRQGTRTIPAYTAEFKQYADRTNYGVTALKEMYYDGLNSDMKDRLIDNSDPQDTYAELVEAVTKIDARIQKRNRQRKNKGSETHEDTRAPYGQGSMETVPMDIDAARMGGQANAKRDQWTKSLQGKCWGCGSPKTRTHFNGSSDECKAKGKNCSHCGGRNHFSTVCADRFMGLEKFRRLKTGVTDSNQPSTSIRAATLEVDDDGDEETARAMDAITIQMAHMAKQQEALTKAMASLKAKGF